MSQCINFPLWYLFQRAQCWFPPHKRRHLISHANCTQASARSHSGDGICPLDRRKASSLASVTALRSRRKSWSCVWAPHPVTQRKNSPGNDPMAARPHASHGWEFPSNLAYHCSHSDSNGREGTDDDILSFEGQSKRASLHKHQTILWLSLVRKSMSWHPIFFLWTFCSCCTEEANKDQSTNTKTHAHHSPPTTYSNHIHLCQFPWL